MSVKLWAAKYARWAQVWAVSNIWQKLNGVQKLNSQHWKKNLTALQQAGAACRAGRQLLTCQQIGDSTPENVFCVWLPFHKNLFNGIFGGSSINPPCANSILFLRLSCHFTATPSVALPVAIGKVKSLQPQAPCKMVLQFYLMFTF